jgi:hypothetical protein
VGKKAAKESQKIQERAVALQERQAAKFDVTADRFADLEERLQAEAAPDRAMARNYYRGIIAGGPEAARVLAPEQSAIRKSYQVAREQLERNAPAGGAIERGRRDLAIAEAGDVGSLFSRKVDEAVARLAQLGIFGTQAGMAAGGNVLDAGSGVVSAGHGMTSAGDALGRLAAARGMAVAGGLGGIAGAIGTYYGARSS